MDYKNLRKDYIKHSMDPSQLSPDPLQQFSIWFEEALHSHVEEPNAMACATVGPDGRPSCRYVLFKELSRDGFVFFTNYQSRKGRELEHNEYCSLVFYWRELERQVRIEGIARKIPASDSEEYFNSRPIGSRISSLVSPQSRVIEDKTSLESEIERLSQLHPEQIKRPDHWGGYAVSPTCIEFWQGRKDRLHDRVQYRLESPGLWVREMLAP